MNKPDKLQRELKRARSASDVGKLEALLEQERYWARRHTIARNKLATAQEAIRTFAMELAKKTSV